MNSFLSQEIIPAHIAPQTIRLHKLTSRTVGIVSKHVVEHDVDALGVSLRLAQGGGVGAIALATSTDVFFVDMTGTSRHSAGTNIIPHELQGLFSSPACVLAGFGMARIALHLHRSCSSRVRGVDLSTLYARSTRSPETPAEFVSARIHEDARRHRIHALWCHDEVTDVCLRAWLSAVCAEHSTAAIDSCSRIDTRNLKDTELRCLSELMMNVELLDAEKPTHMVGEFEQVEVGSDGQLLIRNARFNTRLRPSKQTAIVMETSSGHSITGQAVNAHGKQTGVRVHGNFQGAIERIRVVGREEYTNAEVARDELVLLLLQGVAESLVDSTFVKLLWFPSRDGPSRIDYGTKGSGPGPSVMRESFVGLNQSQKEVVKAMWSHDEPLVVAHGPPGTGKTTTIGAALEEWDYLRAPAWVIAQSNVGVKNIARTLIKYSIDFCIIVSKEFYVEWHEHLYESIQERLIRSDELFSDPVETERRLRGVSTILCTVSMLSNPALDNCAVYRFVPVERLIVDEASQIDSFEFMHLFHKFKTLEKVCMFGDPKQLPPYGKETAPQMKTIFDFKHLKTSAYFLNTQYRMPIPLGEFISDAVYNSKLKSVHKIHSGSCVRFVDVRKGSEESAGSSWKNTEETYAVATLVKKYYKHLDFCIITPYDGQRAAIVERLKDDELPWERVYNVDSFQGHESPYVIISTVRTTGTGFLRSVNRMNVMLTRCKAGMVVVTNRRFLTGSGRDTLLGGLAQRWARTERDDPWIDVLSLSGQSAALPGAPALAGGQAVGTQAMPPSSWGETGTHPRDGEARPQASPRIVPGAWPGAVTSAPAGRAVPQATSTRRTHLEQPGVASTTTQVHRGSRSVSEVKALFANTAPSSPASRNFDADWSPASLATVTNRIRQISLRVPSSTTSNSRPRNLEVGDAFPALGEVSKKPPKLAEGRWRSGSDACKL